MIRPIIREVIGLFFQTISKFLETNIKMKSEWLMKKVIPLLQEYFFDDYEKIGWVMGKSSNPRECACVRVRERTRFQMMFDLPDVLDIVEDLDVFMNPENYIQIYRGEV